MSPVHYDVDGGIATVTLADEENKNALGNALVEGIYAGLVEATEDPGVRAVVLTHTGRVFCAGANLKERSAAGGAGTAGKVGFDEVLTLMRRGPKPVIAKIAGAAMGGGLGLTCAADIAIASDSARFGFTEVRLGVAPAIISVVCLPKMRRGDAMEAFLRGNRFSAERAAELGLVTRAVADDELDAEVSAILDDIVRGGPAALAMAKTLVNDVPTMPIEEAFPWATKLSADLFAGDEAQAGMRAFLDRTDAPWVPQR